MLSILRTSPLAILVLLLVSCSGGDGDSELRKVIESQSTEIAGLQTALAPLAQPSQTATPTATATPTVGFTQAMLPLFQAYGDALAKYQRLTNGQGATYSEAVARPDIQAVYDEAFRAAQDILRSASPYVNAQAEKQCIAAVREWSRFATDYWNQLSKGSSEQAPGRWTYALNFESELIHRQDELFVQCSQLGPLLRERPPVFQ